MLHEAYEYIKEQDQRSTAPTWYQLAFGNHLGPFGSHLRPLRSQLGPFGSQLGPVGNHLGPVGNHLGPFKGIIWDHLGVS